ncbi:EAL domain-containing protein [Blastococcus sp. KM273128]|uniref:EAL domain-containing protein n=1 Tax=Blastococcus sp. KM273128 TaxID=2570314 RepID=UPI001F372425|nr:EAL domain-containing protein [Blastococcus sp. KM273128]
MSTAKALAAVQSIASCVDEEAALEQTIRAVAALVLDVKVTGHLTGPDGTTSCTASAASGGGAPKPAEAATPARASGVTAPRLAVPVTAGGDVVGALVLQRSAAGRAFTPAESDVTAALAQQAGLAIERLRSRATTELLLAGLHLTDERRTDDVPAAADPPVTVRRLLGTARTVLGMELAFLSRISGGEQQFALVEADGTAPRLAEGLTVPTTDGYCELMLSGAVPASVPDVPAHPVLGAMPVTEAIGAGAYCGVPVRLPDGALYGTLCGLSSAPTEPPTPAQLDALRIVAGLIGQGLADHHEQVRTRSQARAELDAVVHGGGRTVALQPIVTLADARTVGYEALSRFARPDGSAVSPLEIFAEAARLGRTPDVELTAARSAVELLPALPPGIYLSINFAPDTVLDPRTAELLGGSSLDRLVIELTEHEAISDYGAVREALAPLRSGGLRLAIDDTGAGFASLTHLTQLAPDIIKLDVAFVRHVKDDPACRAAARAVATYAAEVGATLVAEGIETAAQAAILRELGAEHGQGYYFGRPKPASPTRERAAGASPGR